MKDKNLQDQFHMTDQRILINQKRKEESLLLLRETISQKKINISNDKKQILWNQIRYMNKSMLIIHGVICVFLLLFMVMMSKKGAEEENIIAFSMILSSMLGIVSIIEISRIFFSGITELSESCYFNVKQIIAFHMLISGIINLSILSIGILFVGVRWKIGFLQIGLYVLVPLVFTEWCCLKVLLLEVGRRNSYLLFMVGVFLVVFYMILASLPDLYQMTALGIWGIAFITGLFLLGLQIKNLFRKIEKGEIICTN